MPRLRWDLIGERTFETGVSRGVLYSPHDMIVEFGLDPDGDGPEEPPSISRAKGYTWNGLVSVEAHQNSGPATPIYYDGKKVFDIIEAGDFSATIKALTYPDKLTEYDGFSEHTTGVFFDNQRRDTFSLSWTSKEGNDVNGVNLGYKIHIVYNITIVPDVINYQTIDSNIQPILFSWTASSIPEDVPNHRPTAHIIIDSKKIHPMSLQIIENMLYGDDGGDA